MSIQAMAWALEQKTGSPSAKVVLLTLANYADQKGYCWPSVKRIATESELSESATRRHLRGLEDGRFITTRKRNRSDGSQTSNGYMLTLTRGGQNDRGALADVPGAPVAQPPHEPSCEPSSDPWSSSNDSGPPSQGRNASVTTRRKKTPRRRGTPPTEGLIDGDQADYQSLAELCRDIGQDDPTSVWWTLRKEHAAWEPSRLMASLVDKGEWDGFAESHGISEYNPDGSAA